MSAVSSFLVKMLSFRPFNVKAQLIQAFSDVEKPFFSDFEALTTRTENIKGFSTSDVEKPFLFSDLEALTAKTENIKGFST